DGVARGGPGDAAGQQAPGGVGGHGGGIVPGGDRIVLHLADQREGGVRIGRLGQPGQVITGFRGGGVGEGVDGGAQYRGVPAVAVDGLLGGIREVGGDV